MCLGGIMLSGPVVRSISNDNFNEMSERINQHCDPPIRGFLREVPIGVIKRDDLPQYGAAYFALNKGRKNLRSSARVYYNI